MVGAFSIATDCSSESSRAPRIYAMEVCLIIGISLGKWISGPLYKIVDYEGVYACSVGVVVFAGAVFGFGVEESFIV